MTQCMSKNVQGEINLEEIVIITGVSKGLGEAVAKLFLQADKKVIGISRSVSRQLERYVNENDYDFQHIICDLADTEQLIHAVEEIEKELADAKPEAVYLIHNAAVVEPIKPIGKINPKDLTHHISINLSASMLLLNECIRLADENESSFSCAMVSSGAGDRPIYGWGAYCSTKAAVDMFVRTAALEQKKLQTQHKIISFNPGIMDTGMQETIRSQNAADFADIDTFTGYKENDQLKNTNEIADILFDLIIDESNLESGKKYQAKDFF